MSMDKIKEYYQSGPVLNGLLLFWFITMPFGSMIGALSLGFFTLNLNMVATALLLPMVFVTFRSWKPVSYILLAGVGLLLIRVGIWFAGNSVNADALFDLRSVSMYFIFTAIICSIASLNEIPRNFVLGVRFYFFIVFLFGIVEFISGFHITGSFVKFLETQPIGTGDYAPLFVYDATNDYLVYLMLLFILWNRVDRKLAKNRWMKLSFLLVFLLFSLYASAKIAIAVVCIWMGVELIPILITVIQSGCYEWGWIIGGVVTISLLLFINNWTPGPGYSTDSEKRVLNYLHVLHEENDSIRILTARELVDSVDYPRYINAYYSRGRMHSRNIRMNLIKEGISHFSENPVLGIGPGQFRARKKAGLNKYNTDTIQSPHNYAIEILSQYGLFGIGFFLSILIALVLVIRGSMTFERVKNLLLAMGAFVLLSVPPSGFLYLDINWIFIPILLTIPSIKFEEKEA